MQRWQWSEGSYPRRHRFRRRAAVHCRHRLRHIRRRPGPAAYKVPARESLASGWSPRARKDGLTDRSPPLESGLIDSLGILDLVGFLEERFAIQVTDEELVPENFQTVGQLAVFVAQKKNGARESFA